MADVPKGQIVIRRLDDGDVEAYRALRLAGLRDHPQAFSADAQEEGAWPIADWLARIGRRCTLGAFMGDELVGSVGLFVQPGRKQAHRGQLVGMYVAPAARGTGTGRALVEAALALAQGQMEEVSLSVGIGNAPAIALYLACGFRPYAIDADSIRVDGVPVDDVLMRRRP